MAIPSLAMLPELGRQMMGTAQMNTPLDSIRERRNEREKIEMEKKYKEAMADKALWEIEASKKEVARDEQFRQVLQDAMLKNGQPGAGGGLAAIGTGGGTPNLPGVPGQQVVPPLTSLADTVFQAGFPEKAGKLYSQSATRQSNIGASTNRYQEEQTRNAFYAVLGYETGQDPQKIAEKTGFESKEQAMQFVPKYMLDQFYAAQNAKGRAEPKPPTISQLVKTDEDLHNYFNTNLMEEYDLDLASKSKTSDPDVPADTLVQSSVNKMYEVLANRVKMMRGGAPGTRPGEDEVTAAWREVKNIFKLYKYDPWGPSNYQVFIPNQFVDKLRQEVQGIDEEGVIKTYLKYLGEI